MTDFVVCFDTETTGLDVQRDWIIQLSFVKFRAADFEEVDHRDWYIRPSGAYTIAPSAEEVHHISREMLEQEGVSLRSVYPDMMAFVEGCDLLSYNGNGFDARILYYNLQREGLTFDFEHRTFYDAYIIEVGRTSRRLSDVYRRYYKHDFKGAHNSLADVRATIEVFKAQCKKPRSADEIEREEFDFISLDGFLAMREGKAVFAQGKYKGESIEQVLQIDPSYINWVCSKCEDPTRRLIEQARTRLTQSPTRLAPNPTRLTQSPTPDHSPKTTESNSKKDTESNSKKDTESNSKKDTHLSGAANSINKPTASTSKNAENPEALPKEDRTNSEEKPKKAPRKPKASPNDTQTSLF